VARETKLVLPAAGGSAKFRDLEISVVDVVEKWMMDGSGMMRATLRLRTGGADETIELTSQAPKRTWHEYELDYQGGWRKEVELVVRWIGR
jgi:hypothetical protein